MRIVFEVACVLVVLAGVFMIYPPAALILGGIVGVLAAEAYAPAAEPQKEAGG